MIRWLIFCLLSIVAAQAMDLDEAERALDDSQTLILKNRQPIRGKAVAIIDGELLFAARRGGGSLEYSYPLDQIERLQFPGNEVAYAVTELLQDENIEQALPLMDAMFKQRGPYLDLVTPGELEFFVRYAHLEYHHGDPYKGLGSGQALLDYVQDPGLKRQLDDLILLGNYQLPIKQSTRVLATQWVKENEPYSPSALGYYVLGRLEFDNEEYEAALWKSLEPVAFSSQFPMAYLDYCYALAIASCVELELADEEKKLRAEMAQRGLDWPDIDDLSTYRIPGEPTSTQQPES